MDLQFNQSVIEYLQCASKDYQTQEQTQEIRIPDGMPDVAVVLACWGQPVLRGKEWRSDHVSITGGIMTKILYLPENADVPQVMEAWLPFQMKWSIPNGKQDGAMTVDLGLRGADARVLTSRKIMVRTNLGALLHAFVPSEFTVGHPDAHPDDVQLLINRHCITLPKEAGEKAFGLEETLEFPASEPKLEQIVYYSVSPQILEQKVLSDKLIFRGLCIAHLLYRGTDGQLHSRDFDVPFSQYADLNNEFTADASMQVTAVITNMELENGGEGELRLKAGISGQFVVYDRICMDLVQDAYSPMRTVESDQIQLNIPGILEQTSATVSVQEDPQVDVMRPADVVFWPEQPYMSADADFSEADFGGVFQMLYYDPEGQLQSMQCRWQENRRIQADSGADVRVHVTCSGKPQYAAGMLHADLLANSTVTDRRGVEIVSGLKLGEVTPLAHDRPSLIVANSGTDSLWQIAKSNGSTVEMICKANGLSAEPAQNTVLVIPVL